MSGTLPTTPGWYWYTPYGSSDARPVWVTLHETLDIDGMCTNRLASPLGDVGHCDTISVSDAPGTWGARIADPVEVAPDPARDAQAIADALENLRRTVAGIRGRRGRDFIRHELPMGKTLDHIDVGRDCGAEMERLGTELGASRRRAERAGAALEHMWEHRYDVPSDVLDSHSTDAIMGPVAVDVGQLAEARQALEDPWAE
ncbi:MAG: hypothetical protein AAF211_22300 [Myxococcota bacterium]